MQLFGSPGHIPGFDNPDEVFELTKVHRGIMCACMRVYPNRHRCISESRIAQRSSVRNSPTLPRIRERVGELSKERERPIAWVLRLRLGNLRRWLALVPADSWWNEGHRPQIEPIFDEHIWA
jgi:hypothetical protein